jgi:long-chain acyl-CoA synthetase
MIIRGGENVYPKEIENALYRDDAVLEAAVVGVADDVLGEVPLAFVTLRPGTQATEAALLEGCRAALAPFKRPVGVRFLDELPKNAVGKIDKRSLRERATRAR